jgi:hypothetical protein
MNCTRRPHTVRFVLVSDRHLHGLDLRPVRRYTKKGEGKGMSRFVTRPDAQQGAAIGGKPRSAQDKTKIGRRYENRLDLNQSVFTTAARAEVEPAPFPFSDFSNSVHDG